MKKEKDNVELRSHQCMFVQVQVMNYELDFDDNHIDFLEENPRQIYPIEDIF